MLDWEPGAVADQSKLSTTLVWRPLAPTNNVPALFARVHAGARNINDLFASTSEGFNSLALAVAPSVIWTVLKHVEHSQGILDRSAGSRVVKNAPTIRGHQFREPCYFFVCVA